MSDTFLEEKRGKLTALLNEVAQLTVPERLAVLQNFATAISMELDTAMATSTSAPEPGKLSEIRPPYADCREFREFPASKAALGARNAWDVIRITCEKYGWPLPYSDELTCHTKLYGAYKKFCCKTGTQHLKNRQDRLDEKLIDLGIQPKDLASPETRKFLVAAASRAKRKSSAASPVPPENG